MPLIKSWQKSEKAKNVIDIGVILLIAAISLLVIVYVALPFLGKRPENKKALIEKWIKEERNKKEEFAPDSVLLCPNCSEPIRDRDRYCPNCGKKLLKDENTI